MIVKQRVVPHGDRDFVSSAKSLVDVYRHRAAIHPERIAYTFLADGEDDVSNRTFAEMDSRAKAIAAQLQELGATGERALLMFDSGLEYVEALAGCLYAGVIAVPVYPPDPLRAARTLPRLESVIEDAQAALVLGTEADLAWARRMFDGCPSVEHILETDGIESGIAASWSMPDVDRESLALLQYTSGSTGTPKGVMVSHRNLLASLNQLDHLIDLPDAVGVMWLPAYHDMGLIGGILQAWYSGRQNVFMSPLTFFQRPMRWLRAISKYRATTSGGPNFAFDLCVRKARVEECEGLDLSCWQVAPVGAEPVRADTIERFLEKFERFGVRRELFYPAYGLAEATLTVAGGRRDNPPVVKSFDSDALAEHRTALAEDEHTPACRLVGCGTRAPGEEIAIVDPESRERLEEGRVGEIWVAGPNVAIGYWRKKIETQATFQALTSRGDGPFLRTGDLGFVDRGNLFITGRLKDLIIVNGRNHHPEDIERTVEASHAALKQYCGAAFSVDLEGREQVVIVHEVARPKKEDLGAIEGALRRAVLEGHDLVVDHVALIKQASIPKTSSGKIQRSACREQFLAGELSTIFASRPASPRAAGGDAQMPHVAPRTETEQKVAEVWSDVLGVEQIGVHDDFLELGGTSLLATTLLSRLATQFDMEIDITAFFEQRTVAEVARQIDLWKRQPREDDVELLARLEALSEQEALRLIGGDSPSLDANVDPALRCEDVQYSDYLIVGAGPAGLQLGYCLQKAGCDYRILERGASAGTFFRDYPRHRKLLSINKIYTGYDDPDVNLRWDWNSLLSDDEDMLFRRFSREYFPSADALVEYLGEFARHFDLNVRYQTSIAEIDRQDGAFTVVDSEGNRFASRVLVVATGCQSAYVPPIQGIELAENYTDVSVDPEEFAGQRVLIIGKGNSAFETADNLIGTTSLIHLVSPAPVKMAWKTHFVGHLRAVNNNLLDTYQLKSQNALLDATVEQIRKNDGGYAVAFRYAHASGECEEMEYDRVIVCTGFRFDNAMFSASCCPQLSIDDRFPAQTSEWESTSVPELYFAGTLMQARDFKSKQSAFIHGFRYNVHLLARILQQKHEGREIESESIASDSEPIATRMLERINRNSALWQQTGFLCDAVIIPIGGSAARYFEDMSVDYVHDVLADTADEYFILTMEYGQDRIDESADVFAIERIHKEDADRAQLSASIHPIVRHYRRGRLISEHHVIEDLLAEWKEDVHRAPLIDYFENRFGGQVTLRMDDMEQPNSEPCF